MKRLLSNLLLFVGLGLFGQALGADVSHQVHLVQQVEVDGEIVETIDLMPYTGDGFTTSNATARAGYIFTHWSTSVKQEFADRDAWGRAYEQVSFSLYETMTNTAHYVRADLDSDNDGLADGIELYWYGNLDITPTSDTDGDGIGFAAELEQGTNPHFADVYARGLVSSSVKPQFFKVVIRSEPEGTLFQTVTNNVAPDVTVKTDAYNPATSEFAYWQITGAEVARRDRFGRALDELTFAMPTNDVELVAVCNAETTTRQSLYWYGNETTEMTSDTDGDGFTFAEEIRQGTSPLFADRYSRGVVGASAKPQFFKLILRSDPENGLFKSVTNNVAPGVAVKTDAYNPTTSDFAYWQSSDAAIATRDRFGRALDQLTFAMPTNDVELVAVCNAETTTRQSLYWYGNETTEMTSDTDGDGYTFAEEIRQGTSPLFADRFSRGVVGASAKPQFFKLILKSDPEDGLFKSVTNNVAPGVAVKTDAYNPTTSDFACWQTSDAAIATRDWFGRALDQLTFAMPTKDVELIAVCHSEVATRQSLYWYGNETTELTSDTDGDGFTFAEEIRQGTSPLFADRYSRGIAYALSEELEADLQPFEQMRGALVNGEYEELFTSGLAGNAAESSTFGENAYPIAADVNGDGLFDLLIVSRGKVQILLNKGSTANPDFTSYTLGEAWANFERLLRDMTRPLICSANGVFYVSDDGGPIYAFTLADGTIVDTGLSGIPGVLGGRLFALTSEGTLVANGWTLSLDTPVLDGVSVSTADIDADGRVDLLVSDAVGHIWLYRNITATDTTSNETNFKLLHKVWAGTGIGFAKGMTISVVDWDDDGDQDVLIGTPEGKLMLLRDPRTGRPTNVRAYPGADNVLLTWDPNSQPRIRGYNVYRAPDAESFTRIVNQTPLPRYRDEPSILRDYWYRVTGVSRFYIAGNSTPTVYESLPTDAVYVQFRPNMWLNDTSGFTGSNVTVIVSVNNSMGIAAEGLSLTFTYDSEVLEPRGIRTTGLTEGLASTVTSGAGTETFSATSGEIVTGAGRFLLLDFKIKSVHDITETTVSLTDATLKALDGRAITLDLPKTAKIAISDSDPIVPAIVAVSVDNASVESETEFELPVTLTTTEKLTNFTATVTWDADLLELKGFVGAGTLVLGEGSAALTTKGDDFALKFYAKDPASATTDFSAQVHLKKIAALDCHGFEVQATGATGTVLIRNAHPWVPATVSVGLESVKVDTLTEFEVPVKITSNEKLTNFVATVEWDEDVLEYRGENPIHFTQEVPSAFTLPFYAKDQHTITRSEIHLVEMSAVDDHGLSANTILDARGVVLINDAKPLVPAGVVLNVSKVYTDTLSEFTVQIPVTSTKVLTNVAVTVGYDAKILELRGASGGTSILDASTEGTVVIGAKGTVPSTLYLTFYAKDQHEITETTLTLSKASAYCIDGLAAKITLVDGTVYLTDANKPEPIELLARIGGAKGQSGQPFTAGVAVNTSGDLATLTLEIEWDASLMTFNGAAGAQSITTLAANKCQLVFACAGNYNQVSFDFTAKTITSLQEKSWIRLNSVSGVGKNGLNAVLNTQQEYPLEGTVLIVREVGKYDPGDVDGDGAYTNTDYIILAGYITYLKMQDKGAAFANGVVNTYKKQYGVDVRLTGDAARAADVNCDGEVTTSDLSMLSMLIKEAEGAGQ